METELKTWVLTGLKKKKIYIKSYLQRGAVWKSRILAITSELPLLLVVFLSL